MLEVSGQQGVVQGFTHFIFSVHQREVWIELSTGGIIGGMWFADDFIDICHSED